MHHAFAHQPVSTTLDLVLDAGESVVVQPGSMQLMDTGFTIATSAGGALARRGIGGSFRSVREVVGDRDVLAERDAG